MRTPWQGTPRRRVLWLALIATVTGLHGVLTVVAAADFIGWNGAAPPLRRIDVDLVSELAPAAPPPAAALRPPEPLAAAPVRRVRLPRPAASAAASAALADAAASASAVALAASATDAAAAEAAASAALVNVAIAASAPAAAPSAAASGSASGNGTALAEASSPASAPVAGPPLPALEWPPSTRLTYTVTGMYKGQPCYGSSVVEWRREGNRYQVEFNLQIDFAGSSHMLSEGVIGERGLEPERFEQDIKWALLGMITRQYRMQFTSDSVQLANGSKVERLPGLQDAASQFVQFVWMFSLHPELLAAGHTIEMPLALPRRVGVWVYDAQAPEMLELPFGTIEAVHMQPRQESRKPGEFTLEIWTAPTLQYLPVKLHARLNDETSADVVLKSLPRQAALPSRPGVSAPVASPKASAPRRVVRSPQGDLQ